MEITGIGKEVKELGHTILQIPSVLGQLQQRREETEYERAKLGLFKGTFQFQKSLGTRKDYEQWEEDWQHTHEQLYEQINESIKTEGARNAFEMLYMDIVQKVGGNIGKMVGQKIQQTAIADAGYRIDEYARLGNVEEVRNQITLLRQQGILKIGNTDIGRLQYAKEQEAYANQVRGQLEIIARKQGAEAVLAWITDPASKKESAALSALDATHQNKIFTEVKNKVASWKKSNEHRQTLAKQEGYKKLVTDWETFDGNFDNYILDPKVRGSMQKKWDTENENVEFNFWKKAIEEVTDEDIPELKEILKALPENKLSSDRRDSLLEKLETISIDREYERLDKAIAAAITEDELKVLEDEIRDIPLEKLNRTDKKHFQSRLTAKQKELKDEDLDPDEEQARLDEAEASRLFRAGKLTPDRILRFDTFDEHDVRHWNKRLEEQKEGSNVNPNGEKQIIDIFYDRQYTETQIAQKIAELSAKGLIDSTIESKWLERLDNRQKYLNNLDPAAKRAFDDIDTLTKEEEFKGQESARAKIMLNEFLSSTEYQELNPLDKTKRLEEVVEQIRKEATDNHFTYWIDKLSERRFGKTPEEWMAAQVGLAETIRKPLELKIGKDIKADFEASEFGVPDTKFGILNNGMYVLRDGKGVYYRREGRKKWFRGTKEQGWVEMEKEGKKAKKASMGGWGTIK